MAYTTRIFLCSLSVIYFCLSGCSIPTGFEPYKTHGESVDDRSIFSKLDGKLSQDPLTRNEKIKITIDRGIVQLSGFVGSQKVLNHAINIALQIQGVKDVINSMIVRSHPAYKIERGIAEERAPAR